jgi:hypothetical protein
MILNRFSLPAIALVLVTSGPGAAISSAAPTPQPFAQDRDRDWDIPPREFNDLQRRGFRDGVEGARRDYGNHRRPDVNNREEYRNGNQPEPYRAAFRSGYEMAASHLWGGEPSELPPPPPPPVAPPPGQDWDRWGMRGLENDAERRGYRDGVEEARHDVQFNRNQDPDDQPQFRNPPVPPPLMDEYREGFMRGYEVGLSQLRGEGSWEGRGDPGQWAPPDRFTEWQRRGFHDGVEGARKDFGNHRRPNVSNREEYRDPEVPPQVRHEYREGFRRGYEMAANRLWGGGM